MKRSYGKVNAPFKLTLCASTSRLLIGQKTRAEKLPKTCTTKKTTETKKKTQKTAPPKTLGNEPSYQHTKKPIYTPPTVGREKPTARQERLLLVRQKARGKIQRGD